MRIAIIGYGKMGKEIEMVAKERNHEVVLIIDNPEDWERKHPLLKTCDVAFEFSNPQSVISNIFRCFEVQIPVVVGTTGWYGEFKEVCERCRQKNAALFHASNFSIGVNIFFEINKHLARLMNSYPIYDVKIEETHHLQKVDAPSGTAIRLADDIIKKNNQKALWINAHPQNDNQLEIISKREGSVVGMHTVTWDSSIDQLTLRHEAKSRKGFAMGAVLAGEFLKGKKGIFTMNNLLNC